MKKTKLKKGDVVVLEHWGEFKIGYILRPLHQDDKNCWVIASTFAQNWTICVCIPNARLTKIGVMPKEWM